ncbi:MAG: efflux RND transporter periplasmic adaptor subunit [Paludibacteraceae bacterium]|nr:efflux RND transporter periplasmic adaptor subunit [Paludibacteraceae bacterium]
MRISLTYIVLLTLIILNSCVVHEQRQREQRPVQCQVMVVHPTCPSGELTYMATVQAQAHIPLSLPYGGTVKELPVKSHTMVEKGDVLLRVDDTNARQALATTHANLARAKDAIRRTTPLHDKGLITDIKMVELQTEFTQAQAAYVAARRQVEQCLLTAPQAGLVTYDNLHVGQHVAPEVPVIRLLDMTGFTVVINVPEAEITGLHVGDSAMLSVPVLRQDSMLVYVSQIGVQANTLTHTYPVEAYIAAPDRQLLPGMIGSLTIRRDEQKVIVIPPRCVSLLPQGPSVWVADRYSRAERRLIRLGNYQADGVQVLEGLQDGDQVVVSGYQKLYDNAQLTYD